MLEQCLDWESSGDSAEASYGTRIHHLVDCIATGKAMECSTDELAVADRAYKWLMSLGDLRWNHESRIGGFITETGGTLDCWSKDYANRRLIIVDWKGSLPSPDSMQGKAYALNLLHALPSDERLRFDSVDVIFYNYMDGQTCGATYTNEKTLYADVTALIRRHGGQMGNRRSACKACMYCKHAGSCATAAPETKNALTVLEAACTDLTIEATLDMHDKLAAVMKRAEKIQSALKDRLMAAAKAGELPGYTVKMKRGNKLEWADEVAAKAVIDEIVNTNFMQVNEYNLFGLRSPSAIKKELQAALGESYTKETDAALAPYITQNTYETLARSKE